MQRVPGPYQVIHPQIITETGLANCKHALQFVRFMKGLPHIDPIILTKKDL